MQVLPEPLGTLPLGEASSNDYHEPRHSGTAGKATWCILTDRQS
jgi:hypothetical protein